RPAAVPGGAVGPGGRARRAATGATGARPGGGQRAGDARAAGRRADGHGRRARAAPGRRTTPTTPGGRGAPDHGRGGAAARRRRGRGGRGDVDPLDGHHRAGAAAAPRARTRRAAARAPERLRRRGRTGDAVPRAGRGGGGAPCRPAGPARSAGPRAHRDGPHGERSADDGLGRRGPLVGRPRRPAGAGAVRDVLRLDPRRGRGGRGRRRGARRQRDRALPVLDADPAPDPLTRSTAAASDDKPSVVGAPSGRIDGVSDTVTAEDLRSALLADHRDAAPMMRWWWFGPAVERGELDRELTAMAEAGLGGVEVAFVYPLEQATTTFGSPDLLADLRWTAERARDLGLRFDVTLGSGWSYGGPHVMPAH